MPPRKTRPCVFGKDAADRARAEVDREDSPPAQFSHVHAAVLRALAKHGPGQPIDIPGRVMGVTAERARVTLSRLHRKGLVVRRRVRPNHALYELTALGRKVLNAYELLRRFGAGKKVGAAS